MVDKLNIAPLDGGQPFDVLFNPNAYSIVKPVTWSGTSSRQLNAPSLEFGGGGSRVLTLNLFYDVTEPVNGTVLDDVRQLTNKMAALTQKPDGQQQPPAVTVSWGADPPPGSDFPFTGVVTRLTQNFKLFSRDGKPLRADLTVELTEFFDPETKQKPRAELTSLLVKQGDTLSGIAATNYRDPGRWREIAEANNLDDPRKLAPGLRLSIPKSG